MWEQSKAAKRRFGIGAFPTRFFVGHGIDIGGKGDSLGQYVGIFPLIKSVRTWDVEDGDAQEMAGVPDAHFDFVHSSHCLEHMVDARAALASWIRIVKPGGYLVITVPDEDMYEQGQWPSRYNSDHKWTFTIMKMDSWSPKSINILDLLWEVSEQVEIEKIELIRDFFREDLAPRKFDQSKTVVTECSIEMVLRRRTPQSA